MSPEDRPVRAKLYFVTGPSKVRFPVHPLTRVGLGVAGAVLGCIPGVLVGVAWPSLPGLAWGLSALMGLAGAIRGLTVNVWLAPGRIRLRNLWRTHTFPSARVQRIDQLRIGGMLNATNPALVIEGRRFRRPIHAAMLWGGVLNPDWTDGDRRRARLLRQWADANGVPAAGVIQEMTDPPRPSRWLRLRRALGSLGARNRDAS